MEKDGRDGKFWKPGRGLRSRPDKKKKRAFAPSFYGSFIRMQLNELTR